MNAPRFFSALLCLGLGIAVTEASGQGAGVGKDVIGAGGGSSGNGRLVLRATAGQPAVGDVILPGRLLQQGFWFHSSGGNSSVKDPEGPTTGLSLAMRAQPNPFSESTELLVNIPFAGHITAQLHNARGIAVATLIDGIYQAGTLNIKVDGTHLPSGNYVVILTAGERRATTTLRLVK